MTNSNAHDSITDLFSEIKHSFVNNPGMAFSPDPKGQTEMTMWTGGSSLDNRIGKLSLVFLGVNDGRTRFKIRVEQTNLKTKRKSTPMAGEFYMSDPKFYSRLNKVVENFTGHVSGRLISPANKL